MKIIGLTGSIATGKSFVSNIIKNDFNQPVIDADKLAREIVKPQKPAYNEIIKNFGQKILLENKELNRKLLRKIIFSDPEKKELLNQITHKYIKEEFLKQADYHKKQNRKLVFYDIPLLFETNSEKDFDKIIVVYTPEEIQIKRLMQRDNLNYQEALNTIRNQIDIEIKKNKADFVIDNSGSAQNTRKQIEKIIEKLRSNK